MMAKRKTIQAPQDQSADDLNDRYFTTHFASLVKKHGGQWIVLVEGKLIGIGESTDLAVLVQKAKTLAPSAVPFVAPIPRPEELVCAL